MNAIQWPWSQVTWIAGPSIFQRTFSLKWLGQFQLNFIYSSHGNGWMKICSNGPSHMTKMAARAINRKKMNHLQNCWPICLETWYVALGDCVLPNLFQWWPLVNFDLFHSKVKWQKNKLTKKKFYRTKRLNTLKLGVQYWVFRYYQICSEWMITMTCFIAMAHASSVPVKIKWDSVFSRN